MSAPVTSPRPAGLTRVALVNTALAVLSAGIAWVRFADGHTNVIAVGATLTLLLLGPGLLIRHRLVWRLARPLAYLAAMVLSLLLVFSLLEGDFAGMWMFYVLIVPVVVYLIGVRGYLAGEQVQRYYGVVRPVES